MVSITGLRNKGILPYVESWKLPLQHKSQEKSKIHQNWFFLKNVNRIQEKGKTLTFYVMAII